MGAPGALNPKSLLDLRGRELPHDAWKQLAGTVLLIFAWDDVLQRHSRFRFMGLGLGLKSLGVLQKCRYQDATQRMRTRVQLVCYECV